MLFGECYSRKMCFAGVMKVGLGRCPRRAQRVGPRHARFLRAATRGLRSRICAFDLAHPSFASRSGLQASII